jgi:hypothetical protein
MVSNSIDRFNGLVASLAVKAPCKAVAITNIVLSGEQTVNGIAIVSGDRVLATAQTSAVDNGIYEASSSAWARTADFDGNRDVVNGTMVNIGSTVSVSRGYYITTADPITIGSTALNFVADRSGTVTFTSGDATPTVAEGNLFITAGTTTITDFDNGQVGDVIEIKCSATQRITIADNAAISLKDNRSWHMQIHDTLTLAMFVDQKWAEVGRSENSPTSGVTLDDDVYSANNTLADVSRLSGLILAPATYYQVDGFLKANSNAVSQDLQIKFVTDNAFQEEAYSYHSVDTAGAATSDTGPLTTALIIDIAGNLTIGVRLSGMILTHATLECDVDFQAAQGTAAGNSTIEKGSWIKYKLIGKDS